jgi:acetyltransferase-like isoleucine patch superfamily enzyme
MLKRIIHKFFFLFRFRIFYKFICISRKVIYKIQGMKIGSNTSLPKIHVTWPHQVSIGKKCIIENGVYFKYDGIWSDGPSIIIEDEVFIGSNCEFNSNCGIKIGKFSNIASGCRFIDHDHGIKSGERIGAQPTVMGKIILGRDVWLGVNVVVLKGVTIGDGAVVAAGAVVTKSIPAFEIWAGVPGKKIGERKQ